MYSVYVTFSFVKQHSPTLLREAVVIGTFFSLNPLVPRNFLTRILIKIGVHVPLGVHRKRLIGFDSIGCANVKFTTE